MDLKYPLTFIGAADYKALTEILNNPIFCEDRHIEFKAQFYTGNNSAIELRKDFSSFANNEGGLIFFGIDDRKHLCGINLTEIRREITQKLSGSKIMWDILNSIELPSGKFIYVTQVFEEAFYWKKPIIVDGSIWFRENGTCVFVDDISRFLKYDKFLPSDIKYFEHLCTEESEILERIENGFNSLPYYYERVFFEFEIFLKATIPRMVLDQDKQKVINLHSKFLRFDAKVKDNRNSVLLVQEGIAQAKVKIQNTLIDDLHEIISDFKDIYLDE